MIYPKKIPRLVHKELAKYPNAPPTKTQRKNPTKKPKIVICQRRFLAGASRAPRHDYATAVCNKNSSRRLAWSPYAP